MAAVKDKKRPFMVAVKNKKRPLMAAVKDKKRQQFVYTLHLLLSSVLPSNITAAYLACAGSV